MCVVFSVARSWTPHACWVPDSPRVAVKLVARYRLARGQHKLLLMHVVVAGRAQARHPHTRGAQTGKYSTDDRCSRGAVWWHRFTAGSAVQKVFQGGAVSDLHGMLGITDAADVLYVGDHIYGDILKSKKAMGWRTMLIVPELQMELRASERCRATQRELQLLRQLRDAADERIHRLQWEIESPRCAAGVRVRVSVCWVLPARGAVGGREVLLVGDGAQACAPSGSLCTQLCVGMGMWCCMRGVVDAGVCARGVCRCCGWWCLQVQHQAGWPWDGGACFGNCVRVWIQRPAAMVRACWVCIMSDLVGCSHDYSLSGLSNAVSAHDWL